MLRATATVTPEESLAEQRAQAELADEAWRATIARAAEVLHEDVYGPDGKVEIAGKRVRLRRIGVPDYAQHVARVMKHGTDFGDIEEAVINTSPRPRPRFPGPNRAARRAAAAQARRGA